MFRSRRAADDFVGWYLDATVQNLRLIRVELKQDCPSVLDDRRMGDDRQ